MKLNPQEIQEEVKGGQENLPIEDVLSTQQKTIGMILEYFSRMNTASESLAELLEESK